jgi:hypothetical protein
MMDELPSGVETTYTLMETLMKALPRPGKSRKINVFGMKDPAMRPEQTCERRNRTWKT